MAGDGDQDELDQLLAELDKSEADFWAEFRRMTADNRFRLGPVKVRYHLTSAAIFRWFAVFCTASFAAGVVATFFDITKELGIAMIVGAIFAGGSFVVQYWAVQVQAESEFLEPLLGDAKRRHLLRMQQDRDKLAARIEALQPGFFERKRLE